MKKEHELFEDVIKKMMFNISKSDLNRNDLPTWLFPPKEISFKINVGVGDIILAKYFVDSVKHYFEKIYITPDRSLVAFYRNDKKEYYKFIDDMMSLLFNESPYIVTQKPDPQTMYIRGDCMTFVNTIKRYGYRYNISDSNLRKYFVEKDFVSNKEYIVLSTKVRDVLYKDYKEFSSKFYDLINLLSTKYKIIVIGERRMDNTDELKMPIHKDYIFVIYDDIIKNVKNLVDYSIDEIGCHPDISLLKRDSAILASSKLSICLGDGGNYCWSSVIAPKTISMTTRNLCSPVLGELCKNNHTKIFNNYLYFESEIRLYSNIHLK